MGSSTVSRVEINRSRRLIQDSRVLLATAREALQQAREALARQRYRKIVCAWCQQTIRWEHFAPDAWGQSSHSICSDCFVGIFPELAPGTIPPPLSMSGP